MIFTSLLYEILKDEPEETPASNFIGRMRQTLTISTMKGLLDMFVGMLLGFLLCYVLMV